MVPGFAVPGDGRVAQNAASSGCGRPESTGARKSWPHITMVPGFAVPGFAVPGFAVPGRGRVAQDAASIGYGHPESAESSRALPWCLALLCPGEDVSRRTRPALVTDALNPPEHAESSRASTGVRLCCARGE